MNYGSVLRLCGRITPVVAVVASVIGNVAPVSAQVTWQNGQPQFGADRDMGPRQFERRRYTAIGDGGGRPKITPQAPPKMPFANSLDPGTVIIDTAARKLYFTLSDQSAFVYPISVGREGFKWYGSEQISRKQSWPSWTPPPQMRRRQPYLPMTMTGGVRNPLGAKALYLGDTLYRIHGTNEPGTIGRASSSGCFRMMNHHVLHLAEQVQIGATVHVVRRWTGDLPAAAARQRPQEEATVPETATTTTGLTASDVRVTMPTGGEPRSSQKADASAGPPVEVPPSASAADSKPPSEPAPE